MPVTSVAVPAGSARTPNRGGRPAAGAAPALGAVREDHRGARSVDVLQHLRRLAGGYRGGGAAVLDDVDLLDAAVLAAGEQHDAVGARAATALLRIAPVSTVALGARRQIANR